MTDRLRDWVLDLKIRSAYFLPRFASGHALLSPPNIANGNLTLLTILSAFAILFSSSRAHAFYSTFDTAEISKNYELGLEPQYMFNSRNGPGGNVIAHLDMAATEDSEFKFLLGSGVVPFQAGGFFKWVPIPDYDRQPGIGGFFGVIYADQQGVSTLALRLHPLISKNFKIEGFGSITPYTSIPFGITFAKGNTSYPVQWALGSSLVPQGVKHIHLWTEVGFEMNAAFSYVSLGLSVPFEDFSSLEFN